MHIVLMGLRGSGKSSVGRALAARLGMPWTDLDDCSPALLGCDSVRQAWDTHGEEAFRRAETAALSQALAPPASIVLSLGGGTPTAPGAADLLRNASQSRAACVIYIRLTPAMLLSRLSSADLANRPSLTGAGTLNEIESVWLARDPLYSSLAGITIEPPADATVERVSQIIEEALASRGLLPHR